MGFRQDVEDTYARILDRVEIHDQEQANAEDEEPAIGLESLNPDNAIRFNVPDRPPLEHQGLGTESLDVERARLCRCVGTLSVGCQRTCKKLLKQII